MLARVGGTFVAFVIFVVSGFAESPRVVAVGGPVTEIVCALGEEGQLVGVDSSSVYPESVTKLPQVGYQRQFSAEGVLSLRPTLVLASVHAGPPAAITQLRAAGAKVEIVPSLDSIDGAREKIRVVARALGCVERGAQLIRRLDEELAAVHIAATKQRVLFLLAHGGGTLLAAGQETAADAMIRLAGGENAVTGYTGYKPLTAEAAVAAAPTVVLVTTRGLAAVSGELELWKFPGLGLTPAGKSQRLVVMEDLLLLGFGPRTGQAVAKLAAELR
jgi:iron complex transport system substrate-binding protein